MRKYIYLLIISFYLVSYTSFSISIAAEEEDKVASLLTNYYNFMNENKKPTQEELKGWVVQFENIDSDVEGSGNILAFNQVKAQLYYETGNYNNAEKLYAKVLANVSSQIDIHPNVTLDAAYKAFRSSLFIESSADDSMIYLDLFQKVFDDSIGNKEVVSSFAFERAQVDRYRAKAYEVEYDRLNEMNLVGADESLKRAIEWQKKYVDYLTEEENPYNKISRLDHMGWGLEGSLYELGKYQDQMAELYRNQNLNEEQIRRDSIETYERLLNEFPQNRYSDSAAARLIKQKAFLLKDPKQFLDYSKSIIDKVENGYEYIGVLRECMMQIASYNQWPDGPKWENSGGYEAKLLAIEIGDFIREATEKIFSEDYKNVNILKHSLMMQVKYCIDTDNFVKAIDIFNEVRGYGIEGEAFIKLFNELEDELKVYIGNIEGGNLENILEPDIVKDEFSLKTNVNNSIEEVNTVKAIPLNNIQNVQKSTVDNKTNKGLFYVIGILSIIFLSSIFGLVLKR